MSLPLSAVLYFSRISRKTGNSPVHSGLRDSLGIKALFFAVDLYGIYSLLVL